MNITADKFPPSPLLKRLHDASPDDIHAVAAQTHLITAFEMCRKNTLVDAVWNGDKSTLIASFSDGARTTLLLEGFRLLTTCTCREWQPARNCPHVVIVWAALKRTVSPEALPHIRFNRNLLSDLRRFINREPVTPEQAHDERPGRTTVPESPACRLLIVADGTDGELRGRFMRGNDVISGWTTIGIPTDLARFMASHPFYESTPRYFSTFLALTGGRYAVTFRDDQGHETPLTFRGDDPRQAGISFDIRGEEVIVRRTLDNGMPIPQGAVAQDRLLFDPDAAAIHPLTDLTAWRYWDDVVAKLKAAHDCRTDAEARERGDRHAFCGGATEPPAASAGLRQDRHAVAVPLSLFNVAGIELHQRLASPAAGVFSVDGVAVETPRPAPSAYLLDIPAGLESPRATLLPSGSLEGIIFPCSLQLFWILDPSRRTSLPPSLRSRKRLHAVLKAAFSLLDGQGPAGKQAIIRNLAASPDFSRPEMLSEAELFLDQLLDVWSKKGEILLAAPDGWRCAESDHERQAKLLRIMCEVCGPEAFNTGLMPGELWIEGPLLWKVFPRLMERLGAEGFTLRVATLPVADVAWEFFLDASASGLDWFELHPEIRCDGEALSGEEIRALLEGNGMLCRKGRLLMMDEGKTGLLAAFAAILPAAEKKGKTGDKAVRLPRLRMLEWLQLRREGVRVRLPEEDARVLESLLDFQRIPERPLPAAVNASLRHYQADAWRWLAFLYEHRFGACLADDMGLGKTLQGITLLAGITSGDIRSSAPAGAPHLVVAPPSLLFNWEAEIARFFPAARVLLYSGPGRSMDGFGEHDIIITSYGIVQRDVARLARHPYDVIIFDETQVVKNLQAATTGAVRRLRGAFVLALTGTPVENNLGEFYSIMDLCLPGLLGNREEFGRRLGRGGEEAAGLIRRTRPFVLRRTKEMIANELPPKIEIDIQLEMTPKQKALYQRTVEEVRGQVREAFDGRVRAQARIIALTAILRLRQICLSPSLTGAPSPESSPKLDFLLDQLRELRDEGHSALVFSQFTGYLDLIQRALTEGGVTCLRLDGSTPVPQRKTLVRAFQNSAEPAVFLISLKAGGRGLNLTRASYVYHMDPWWNPAVENQASDRAHRIGQTGQVTITRLTMRHSIEEKMMRLKEKKLSLYQAILGEGSASAGSALTREDFEFLLG